MATSTPPSDTGQPSASERLKALNQERKNLRQEARQERLSQAQAWVSDHRPHLPRPRRNGKSTTDERRGFSGTVLAVVTILALVAGVGGTAAIMTAQDGSERAALQSQVNQLQDSINDLQDTVADVTSPEDDADQEETTEDISASAEDPVIDSVVSPDSERGPPVTQEEILEFVLASASISPEDYTQEIDPVTAQRATSGAGSFGDAITSTEQHAVFLASGTPKAQAAMEVYQTAPNEVGIFPSRENLLNPGNWIAFQMLIDTSWGGNHYYSNGQAYATTSNRIDPAGTVGLLYVGPEVAEYIRTHGDNVEPGAFVGTRGACQNPQSKPPTPKEPPVTPPPPDNPPPEEPPVTPPPPEEPPTEVQRCDVTTNEIVTISEEQAKDTDRYKPVGDEACKDTPPPPPPVVVCINPETGETGEVPADEADNYLPVGHKDCGPDEPPTDEPEKCEDLPEESDGFCGTPNEGAEQQPVDDNGDLDEPTPGYTPGDAEENAEEQGPPCSGDSCGLDPTPSGTEVEDSKDGGEAPGGDVVTPVEQPDQPAQPEDSGQPNPDYDGTPPTENPDEGTSDPVDTPVTDETTEPGSDPLEDLDLPNVEP